MASRLELQRELETLLGYDNVYYKPPSTIKMSYPAIRYKRVAPDIKYADDKKYEKTKCYEIIVISRTPDLEVIDSILDMDYSSYDRNYISDGLYHDVITLFY